MTRRRPGDGNALLRGDVAVALALMAVAAAGIGKGLLPGRTVLPLDNLGVFLPWQGTLGPPANPLLGDPVQQFSSRLFVAEALRAARLPLWNPHVMAGHPLAGDVQAEVFNPILWLLAATLSPLRGFTAQVALQLWLAGLFMYVWMRVLVGDRFASLGAALV